MNGFEVGFIGKKVTIGMRSKVLVNGSLIDKFYLSDISNNEVKPSFDYLCVCYVCVRAHGWFGYVMTYEIIAPK